MSSNKVRGLFMSLAVATLSVSYAAAQGTPVDPSTATRTNPNPATSSSTDDQGMDTFARDGDHSPTGQNSGNLPPAGDTNANKGTVGQAPSPQTSSPPNATQQNVSPRGEPKGGQAVTPD
jgi:hypothetical protein